uniref:Putative secreted protein n=1 Tax=Lutzomyia longipalpis TaxID=7200 RepID=A0A7G3AH11_LUTLO
MKSTSAVMLLFIIAGLFVGKSFALGVCFQPILNACAGFPNPQCCINLVSPNCCLGILPYCDFSAWQASGQCGSPTAGSG